MSSDERRVREKLAVDYRIACPNGHTSLEPAETTPSAYCRMCGRTYSFAELVDRRHLEGGF